MAFFVSRDERLVVLDLGVLQAVQGRVEGQQVALQLSHERVRVLPADLQLRPARLRPGGGRHADLAPVRCLDVDDAGEYGEHGGDAVADAGQAAGDLRGDLLDRLAPGLRGEGAAQGGDGRADESAVAAEKLQLLVDARLAELEAELLRRDLLEVVGLIDDQHVVVGYERPSGGQVGDQQRVVDDDDVRRRGPLPSSAQEADAADALAVRRALRRQPVPGREGAPAAQVQLRPVAGRRAAQPRQGLGEHPGVLLGQALAGAHVAPPLQAQVVRPALQQRRLQVLGRYTVDLLESLDEVGDVLAQELLLEVDGVGRYDHPDVVLQGVERGGDEVRERLADAGTRLDHKPLPVADGLGDGPRHGDLLRPLLEPVYRPRQGAVGAQDRRRLVRVDALYAPVRAQRPLAVQPAPERLGVDAGDARAGGGRDPLREPVRVQPAEQVLEHPGRPRRQPLHLREGVDVHPGCQTEQLQEDAARDRRVRHRAMRTRVLDPQRRREVVEGVVPVPGQQHERHVPRVGPRVRQRQPAAPEEVEVEPYVVADDRRRADEGRQPGRDLREGRRAVDVVLADARVAPDEAVEAAVRVDQGRVGV